MVQRHLFDKNCQDGNNPVPNTVLAVTTSKDPSWTTQNANLQRTISLNITVNPQTISKDTNLYQEGKDAAN